MAGDEDAIEMVLSIAQGQREWYQKSRPAEYEIGYTAGFLDKKTPALRYPEGFHEWEQARRNAWYSGWNEGYRAR